ncbi:hypothetical protein [Enterobacter asburiae]|uniref:hypothetical protein n=1 Tax=Enterobacter asburiae TaxID=61645 RepID=UPI00192B2828|nr:hypothetical protein [Enterobacter asburiae]MBL5924950.1 hypothetical protein [Enterobacter asburiae]MBL5955737.1 hypothetical protein [Enterobacter asburiae]
MTINAGESGSIEIPFGEEVTLESTYPIDFVITTKGGSVIKMTVTANNPLKITKYDDIESIVGTVNPVDSDIRNIT